MSKIDDMPFGIERFKARMKHQTNRRGMIEFGEFKASGSVKVRLHENDNDYREPRAALHVNKERITLNVDEAHRLIDMLKDFCEAARVGCMATDRENIGLEPGVDRTR